MEENGNKKYKLVLRTVLFDAGEKINLLKKIREVLHYDLETAKRIVDTAPSVLIYDLSEDYAMILKSQLAGINVTLEPMEENDYGKSVVVPEDPSSYVMIGSFKEYFKYLYDFCLAIFSGSQAPKYKYSTKFKIYIAIFWIIMAIIWGIAIFVPAP